MAHKPYPPEDRFWKKIDFDGPVPELCPDLGPCWIWLAAKVQGNYGRFYDGTRLVPSHRFAYETLIAPVNPAFEMDHLCRNHSCTNPFHLEPVTRSINVRRGTSIASKRAAQTHCLRGHEFTEENTFHSRNGTRTCRPCRRAYDLRRRPRGVPRRRAAT